MANLRIDLQNKIGNEKYFSELELVRLAQDPNTNYKDKIDTMIFYLEKLAILNAQIALIEQYFQEPQAVAQSPVVQQPTGQVIHQGQTHGE